MPKIRCEIIRFALLRGANLVNRRTICAAGEFSAPIQSIASAFDLINLPGISAFEPEALVRLTPRQRERQGIAEEFAVTRRTLPAV